MDFKKEFKNKNIVLTGSSKGLGRELLKNLNNFDCNIILLNRKKNNINIKNNKISIINCDFQKINLIPETIKEILSITKKIDVIYHIAGGGLGFHDPLINANDFLKVFNLNLLSILEINRLLLPYMIKRKKGNIVHIGSTASNEALASLSYNTSKYSLSAYVRSLGKALIKDNIIINGISPGAFEGYKNAMFGLKKKNKKIYNEFINNRLPRNKMGQASELIFLLLYLGSSKSSFTSSNLLTIDAGEGNIY